MEGEGVTGGFYNRVDNYDICASEIGIAQATNNNNQLTEDYYTLSQTLSDGSWCGLFS